MLDIKFIAENPSQVKDMLKKRFKKDQIWMVDELIRDYDSFKLLKKKTDDIRARRNTLSQEINDLKKSKKDASKQLKEAASLPKELLKLEEDLQLLTGEINKKLMQIPNLLHESVPVAEDESKNEVVRKWGKITKQDFKLQSHVDIIEKLDLADLERGAKVAGARFYYLKNELAELDIAVTKFALDKLKKKGYTLIRTPDFVKKEAMEGAAELSDFQETLYQDQNENLFLIATAEHAIASMHQDETLGKLPLKYAGFSECFRREAGAHGKDTKGIFRVHEFRKVEQFVFCNPKDSWKIHEELIKNAEEIFQELELPYRIINIASGALNNAAAKKYDLETWMPAQNEYREMVSCSNCLDYQARKLKTRYNINNEKGHPHLLNATAVATPRILVAIIENFQQKDGSIRIPKALHPYLSFKEIKPKK